MAAPDEGPAPGGPAVVLVEPACVVAGRECAVEVHLSREVACGEGLRAVVREEGGLLASAPLAGGIGTVVRLPLPPLEPACLSIALEAPDGPPAPPPPALLVLPEAACDDLRRLFAMMLSAVATRDALLITDLLRRHPVPAVRPPPGPLAPDPDGGNPTALAQAVWTDFFRPLAVHLAQVLKDLAEGAGDDGARGACVPTLVYLLDNELWRLASFLLKACLAFGVPVTLGPFALQDEDVEPERLRRDYQAIGHGAVLVVGEVEREGVGDATDDGDDDGMDLPLRTLIDEGLRLLEPMSG